jgi:hypothetical protein
MKAVEYTAPILADGRLEVPPDLKERMHLRPGMQVKVILLYGEESAADEKSLEARRAAVWEGLDELRAHFSQMNFNLTDALLQAREEEDASL